MLDPKNIIIEIGGGFDVANNDEFAENASGTSVIDPIAIVAQLDTGVGLQLLANNDITINDDIITSGISGAGVTIEAGRSIAINANIDLSSFSIIGMQLFANANNAGVIGSERDAGAATFTMAEGATIQLPTNGGSNLGIGMQSGAEPTQAQVTLQSAP